MLNDAEIQKLLDEGRLPEAQHIPTVAVKQRLMECEKRTQKARDAINRFILSDRLEFAPVNDD